MSDPARRPRVAVIGCGYWGKNLVRNFAALDALAAVADADPTIAAAFATEYCVGASATDELFADAKIDAVVIATPAELHSSMALRALRAGKHVFVEKPLALRLDDAARLIDVAEETGRVLMVGHLLQYHPCFLHLRDMIRSGGLGRLQYIYSNRLNLVKIRREEDVFWSFAPHDISMILSLAGEEPDRVRATGASYLHRSIADVTTTHMSFPNGVNAHIFVSWLHPFKEQKLVVVGEQGMAVFDDTRAWPQKLAHYAHEVAWHNGLPEPVRAEPDYLRVDEAEPLRLECEHFLECVEHGRRPRTDGHDGMRVLRVLDAAAGATVELGTDDESGHDDVPRFPGAQVHESAFVDAGVEIGDGTKIWHFSHVLGGTRIGRDCLLGQNVMAGPDVVIGDRCKIQNNVSLYKGVVLEDGVFCGPSCVFTNVINPRAEVDRRGEFRETRVGHGASIGANATLICGNPIGEYSFIAAGAVVTKPVPPHALVAGVPAKRVGWMSHAGECLGPDLVCPRSERRYAEQDANTLVELAQEQVEA